MRNKKGFTLIELLAVIVILAIIAIIATPIVLNIINNSRKSATERSAENYLAAVEQAVAKQELNNTTEQLDGTYTIIENGKKIQKGSTTIAIKYDGTGLESGKIVIEKGSVKNLIKGKIGNEYATMSNGKVVMIKGNSTLISGKQFDTSIRTLLSGSKVELDDFDSGYYITSGYIGFYSNGNLPKGYTKNSLVNLPNVSVSDDDKVKAYYDSETKSIYVYSENQIYANPDSSYMLAYIMADKIDLYLSELDTSKVTNMSYMFAGQSGINGYYVINLENFNTSKVTNMKGMFSNCTKLSSLDLSNFDTSKVTDMSYMFNYAMGISSLDLSSFDTSNVADMTSMFESAQLLETITVSDKWVISSSTLTSGRTMNMFTGCGTSHVTVK